MLFGVFFLIAYLKLYFTSWLKIKQIDGMIFNEEYFFNLTLRLFFTALNFVSQFSWNIKSWKFYYWLNMSMY